MEILGLQVVNELRQQIRAAANEAKGAGFHGGVPCRKMGVPSGKTKSLLWKITYFLWENPLFFMGKSNSYVKLPEGTPSEHWMVCKCLWKIRKSHDSFIITISSLVINHYFSAIKHDHLWMRTSGVPIGPQSSVGHFFCLFIYSMAMTQEPIYWRYLPHIRPKFRGISPQNMAQNMVLTYLHFPLYLPSWPPLYLGCWQQPC